MSFLSRKIHRPNVGAPPPGRDTALRVAGKHLVLGTPLVGRWPEGMGVAVFGMGCFLGIERLFYSRPGVHSTAAGYAGGSTPNPTYREARTVW